MALVVYARTSISGNGDSVAAQRDACRRWAAAEGHEVATAFCDDGLSGKLSPDDRPGLLAALIEIEEGRADGVLIHRLDRFARELHVQEAALARIWNAGGHVFEAVDRGEVLRDDPDDPYRKFIRQVMGAASELERGMISLRMRGGRKRKHALGGYAGGPTVPFGQRVEGFGKEARRVADPAAEPVIERVLVLRRSGLTLARVAEQLNAEGVLSPGGGRWHPTTVQRVVLRASGGCSDASGPRPDHAETALQAAQTAEQLVRQQIDQTGATAAAEVRQAAELTGRRVRDGSGSRR